MKAHFDEREIVELTLFACLFNAWNRLQDGLRVELEPPEGRIRWMNAGGAGETPPGP